MLKTVAAFVMGFVILSSGVVYADHDVKMGGTVKNIDIQNNTFVINEDTSGKDMMIKVNPATDFEAKANKNNLIGWDKDVRFEYLQVGDWVEIEVSDPNMPNIVAEEVKIYRK